MGGWWWAGGGGRVVEGVKVYEKVQEGERIYKGTHHLICFQSAILHNRRPRPPFSFRNSTWILFAKVLPHVRSR